MSLLLVANPYKGHGRAGERVPGILRHIQQRGLNAEWKFTEGPHHAVERIRIVEQHAGLAVMLEIRD